MIKLLILKFDSLGINVPDSDYEFLELRWKATDRLRKVLDTTNLPINNIEYINVLERKANDEG